MRRPQQGSTLIERSISDCQSAAAARSVPLIDDCREEFNVSTTIQEPTTWPDFAEGLYEKLTGRGSQISYHFDDMIVEVPRDTSAGAPRATWRLHGKLHISTAERRA